MATTKAKILLVDDNALGRDEISDLIAQDFGYPIHSPNSLKGVREAITFEIFDSLLVDVDLSRFDDIGSKIDSKTIDDGTDLADFYSDLHEITSGRLYSSHLKLPGSPFDFKIKKLNQKINKSSFPFTALPKPLPRDMDQIKELFKPLLEEAEKVRRSNPLLRPLSDYDDRQLSARLRAYKKVLQLHSSWFHYNFQSVGDASWGVICGRSVDRRYYGQPLKDKGAPASEFDIHTSDKYPTKEELSGLGLERDAFPFVIWNTRRWEFIEQQFQNAGPRLANIPDYLQDFFGICMVPCCVNAFEQKGPDQTIEWCKQLTTPAQIEISKKIYRKLYRTDAMKAFVDSWKTAGLPSIIEIYDARVDSIETVRASEQIAWVELRNIGDYRAIAMEPFDLNKLRGNDIDHESQRFEYTVYQLSNNDVAMNIDPVDSIA
jgi:hypothetical protein